MNHSSRPLSYSVLSYRDIESMSVRDRLQLMQDLWNSIFFGGGRNAGDLWFPLPGAIYHEFERRLPDNIRVVETPQD